MARSPTMRLALFPELEYGQKRLLGYLDPAHLLHPLLAAFLLLEQLALARDIAAVALGNDVLAVGLDRLPRHDPRPDRGLDRDVVLLAGDLLAQLLDQRAARRLGLGPVNQHRQRVDRLAGEQDVELDQVRLAQADQLVVKRRVATGTRL